MAFVHIPGNPEPEGAEEIWFEGRGGVRVRALWAPALSARKQGSVILCNGRTEFIEKYFEVIREFQSRGFSVLTLDWRGQGLSDRLLANRLKGHLTSFDDLVNDLATALRGLGARMPHPRIVVAHSMGGAIALRGLQTRRLEADAAVFSAPMWGIASLSGAGLRFARFCTALGLGHLFAPGANKTWKRERFWRNAVTHDKPRFERAQELLATEPKLAVAGVTLGWIDAAAGVCEGFRQAGSLAHIRMPVVVLSALKEVLVRNESHIEIAGLLPQARRVEVRGAKHEILMETDEIRAVFWDEFDALARRAAPV
jgi:lysophospholipase